MCTPRGSKDGRDGESEVEPRGKHHQAVEGDRRNFMAAFLAGAPLLLQMASLGRAQTPSKKGKGAAINTMSSSVAMTSAAETFLSALSPEQRAKATFSLEDQERQNWFYTPVPRKGITLRDLDPAQRQLGNVLLSAGLAQHGLVKVANIISLEPILKDIEQGRGPVRDSELYYFSLFGKPGAQTTWGWRFEGHHLSLHYTVSAGGNVASTPSFLGSNPAEVQHGPRKGLRPLANEEDFGRALVKSLDDKQRAVAVVSNKAPADILSTNGRKADPVKPAGLQANKLGQKQADLLMNLLKDYATNMPPDIAAARMDRVRSGGIANIFFAWAGELEHLQPHYYRVQGPNFLIEYDCTQNNANHIHSVWRDFNGDFGQDLLAGHYDRRHR